MNRPSAIKAQYKKEKEALEMRGGGRMWLCGRAVVDVFVITIHM